MHPRRTGGMADFMPRIAQPATYQPEPRSTGPGIGYDPAGSRFHRDTHSVMVTVPEPDGKAQHAAGRSRAEPACRPGRHHQGICRNSISSPDSLGLPSLGRTRYEAQRHEPARQPEGRCIGRTCQSRILPTGLPGGPRWNRVGSQMRIEPPPGPRRPRTCGRANPRTGHQRYSPHARCPRSATPASVRGGLPRKSPGRRLQRTNIPVTHG